MMALNQRSLNMQDPAFDPNRPDDTGNARLGLGAKMRLLDFGRRANDRRAAVSAAGAQSEMFAAVRNDLVHEVTRGFYTVLQAQSFVAVQQEQVRSLEESLRVARARMDRGAAVKSDVLSLEVRLAQAQEDLIRARNGVGLAVAALNTAIGRDLVPETGLDAVPPEQVPDLPADAAPDASGWHPAVRARDGVKLDQRQARLQAREARERWTLMAKSVESADEALRMTKARYEQGAADVPELLNAELGLAAVRSRRVAAVYDYLTALSNIGRAAGELAPADGAK
ncbi:MAG: hypothetical protein BWK77_04530 [Verrucomicrobia bacterium A1]|nr:MAG: hypothetical protein BWK77_04530 [Verrucomicrobia bacterium A1]